MTFCTMWSSFLMCRSFDMTRRGMMDFKTIQNQLWLKPNEICPVTYCKSSFLQQFQDNDDDDDDGIVVIFSDHSIKRTTTFHSQSATTSLKWALICGQFAFYYVCMSLYFAQIVSKGGFIKRVEISIAEVVEHIRTRHVLAKDGKGNEKKRRFFSRFPWGHQNFVARSLGMFHETFRRDRLAEYWKWDLISFYGWPSKTLVSIWNCEATEWGPMISMEDSLLDSFGDLEFCAAFKCK